MSTVLPIVLEQLYCRVRTLRVHSESTLRPTVGSQPAEFCSWCVRRLPDPRFALSPPPARARVEAPSAAEHRRCSPRARAVERASPMQRSCLALVLVAWGGDKVASQCMHWGHRTPECTEPCTHAHGCYDYACVGLPARAYASYSARSESLSRSSSHHSLPVADPDDLRAFQVDRSEHSVANLWWRRWAVTLQRPRLRRRHCSLFRAPGLRAVPAAFCGAVPAGRGPGAGSDAGPVFCSRGDHEGRVCCGGAGGVDRRRERIAQASQGRAVHRSREEHVPQLPGSYHAGLHGCVCGRSVARAPDLAGVGCRAARCLRYRSLGTPGVQREPHPWIRQRRSPQGHSCCSRCNRVQSGREAKSGAGAVGAELCGVVVSAAAGRSTSARGSRLQIIRLIRAQTMCA